MVRLVFSNVSSSLNSLSSSIKGLPVSEALTKVNSVMPRLLEDLKAVCEPAVKELTYYCEYLRKTSEHSPFDKASVSVAAAKFSSVMAGLSGGRKTFSALHKEAEILRQRYDKEALRQRSSLQKAASVKFPVGGRSHSVVMPTAMGDSSDGDASGRKNLHRLASLKFAGKPELRSACWACALLDLPIDTSHGIKACPNVVAAISKASTL